MAIRQNIFEQVLIMSLFNNSELLKVRAIADINYANPFLPERIELVRVILGDKYVHHGDVWSVKPGQSGRGNLQRLQQITAQLAESAIDRIRSGIMPDNDELKTYEGLMVYYLFEKYREDFASLIKYPEGAVTEACSFYHSFSEDVNLCLVLPGKIKLPSDYKTPHLFAMYFQIHRAFSYIFDFLIGGSMATANLRSAIWQSIFTHDIHRYQRSLFNQMSDVTTLITGPSGTGKELVARAIAYCRYIPFSVRKMSFAEDFRKHFFPLHLSAMPANLIESELFGHKKGAYTGALQDRIGWLEEASEYSTVFLDEIGEISEEIQVKLLRLIQNRTFQRLGDTVEKQFRGKIIAATNRDLSTAIKSGKFRSDFYYRLCSDQIATPSLKEQLSGSRKELQNLVDYLATRIIGEDEAKALASESVNWIEANLGMEYRWPGNVRELEQCIRNIMIRGFYQASECIYDKTEDSLAELIERGSLTAEQLLARYCKMIFRETGSYTETARRLDLDRRTVKSKLC
jgi:transcriptional regulator with AAA-type ATPase domain